MLAKINHLVLFYCRKVGKAKKKKISMLAFRPPAFPANLKPTRYKIIRSHVH